MREVDNEEYEFIPASNDELGVEIEEDNNFEFVEEPETTYQDDDVLVEDTTFGFDTSYTQKGYEGTLSYKNPKIISSLRESKDLERAMSVSDNDLAYSLEQTRGLAPSEAKRIAEVAKLARLPEDVVRRNLKTAQDYADFNKAMGLLGKKTEEGKYKYPRTAKFLMNPDNMKMAKNDTENLAEIENILREQNFKDSGFFGDVFKAINQGSAVLGESLARTPALLYDIAAIPQNVLAKEFGIGEQVQAPEWLQNNPVAKYYEDAQKRLVNPKTEKSPLRQFSEGEIAEGSYNVFLQAITNTPVLATMAMGNYAGLSQAATLAGMGAISASDTNNEAREKGKDPLSATTNALLSGTAEAVFEKYTLGLMARNFKSVGTDMVKTLGKDGAKKRAFKDAMGILGAGLGEGQSEAATTIAQDFADYITGDKNAMDGVAERAINSAMVGFLPGASMQSLGTVRTNFYQSKYLHDQTEFMTQVSEKLDGTELKKLNPVLAENYVNELQGQKENIYIPAETLQQFFQKKTDENGEVIERETLEMDFNQVVEDLGIKDQVEESLATGKELEVDKAKWIVNYANTDIGKSLQDDIRYNIEGLTKNEEKDLRSSLDQDIEKIKNDIDQVSEEENIEELAKIREILKTPRKDGGAGFGSQYADSVAAFLLAGAKTFAGKNKESVKEFFERTGFDIQTAGQYIREQEIVKENATGLDRYRELDGETLVMANDFIAEELQVMYQEIQQSQAGSRVFSESESGGAPKITSSPSTFPSYFRELGVNKKRFLAALDRGKGKVYDRIKDVAIQRLIEGYENNQSGQNLPSDDFRALLNLGSYKGSDTKFTLFQRSSEGLILKRGEFPSKDFKDIEQARFRELEKHETPLKLVDRKEDVRDRLTANFLGDNIKIDSNNFELKLTFSSLESMVEQVYSRYGKAKKSNRKKADKLFTNYINALINIDRIIEDSIKVAKDDLGNDIYFAVSKSGKDQISTRFKVSKNEIIDLEIASSVAPNPQDILTVGSSGPSGQGDLISIGSFKNLINKDRNNLTFFQEKLDNPLISKREKEIEDSRQDAISKVEDQGFTIEVEEDATDSGRFSVAVVDSKGRDVAVSFFDNTSDNLEVHPTRQTKVGKKDRRKGMANAMYARAEQYSGKTLNRPKSQTKLAQSLWSQENRPFGNELFQDGDDSVKGLIDFSDQKSIVKLFESADKSTALHEIGHFFLNEMQRSVDLKLADEQTIKDLETLKEFADGEFNVDGIEKVVRGFEAYLMEGKAPSVNLEGAFRKFKKWLTTIYKKVKGLPEINDDVRAVFDRMLATETEIAQVKRYYEAREDLAKSIKATPKEIADLNDKEDESVESAEEKLLSKYMKAYTRSIGGKKTILDEARREIDSSPVYQAIEDGKVQGISESDILDYAGELELETLRVTHRGLVKKKSKISIAELAEKHNFENPFLMIDEIARAESRGDAIKKKADQFLKQKENEILSELQERDGRRGDEEFHNDARLSFLIAEYELIQSKMERDEKSQQRKIDRKVFKDAALEILMSKTTATATRYDLFGKTEQKYANQAVEFAKKGDLQKSSDAKRKQILNHIMVQEAVKLRDYKVKALNKYKTKALSKRIKNIEHDYMDIASDVIGKFGLNAAIQTSGKDIKKIQDIDESLYSQLPEWVQTGITPSGSTSWKEMTMGEFQELHESIDAIIHSGRGALLSLTEGQFKTVQELVDASIGNMEELKDKKVHPEFTDKEGLYGYVDQKKLTGKKFVDNLLADTVMFEYLFEKLDNYSMHRTGEFGVLRQLFNKGREAESEYKDIMKRTIDAANPHYDLLNEARMRIEKQKGKAFQIDGVQLPDILTENGFDKWTVEKMVALLLNTGNVHNKEVIENAYQFNQEQINRISQFFTTEELMAIQGIWDVTNTLFDPLNETNFRMHNRYLPKVEAQEIELINSNGEVVKLPGGYYPLAFDRNVSDIAEKQQEDDMLRDRNKSVLRSSKPKDGMTKARTGTAHSLPPLLSISVWQRHISDTSRYIAMSEYLRDASRITKNEQFKSMVRKKAGKRMYSNLSDWLKYQARPERQVNGKWNRFLDSQRSLATSMILGLNMSVALKQRLSGFSAQTDLGGTWLLKALRDSDIKGSVLGMDNSQLWQQATKKSKYLRAREGAMDREIHDIVSKMNPFIKSFDIPGFDKKVTFKDAQDAVFFLIQANDRAMTGLVWKAAYMKSLDQNKNILDEEKAEQKAITYADSVVATTQPSSLPIDLNTLQKEEGPIRLFTAFMTWTYKQGNRFGHKYTAWRAGAISTKEYTQFVINEHLMAAWGASIIGSLLLNGELPEWWEYMTGPAEYGISWIPIVRDVPGAIKYRRAVGNIPAFEGANRVVDTGTKAVQWANGDKEYHEFLWSLGYTMEAMTGIPALKVVKNMKNTKDILTGEKKKK